MEADVVHGLDASVGPRCLVTGAAGYVGRHLVDALVELGCAVYALDLAPCPGRVVQEFRGDVRDEQLVRAALAQVDVVFHAAVERASTRDSSVSVARLKAVNVGGTHTLLRASERAGVSRFIHVSSAAVVLDRELLEADESSSYATSWVDPTDESVAAAEREVLGSHGKLRTLAVRPAAVWGPGDGGPVVRTLLAQLAARRFVAVSGTSVVDRTHVHNLVRGLLLASVALQERPEVVGGMPYFITDDERIDPMEWCAPIFEAIGHPVPTSRLPSSFAYTAAWAMEWMHRLGGPPPSLTRTEVLAYTRSSAFNIDRARRDLGYTPLRTHADMTQYLEDYRVQWQGMG